MTWSMRARSAYPRLFVKCFPSSAVPSSGGRASRSGDASRLTSVSISATRTARSPKVSNQLARNASHAEASSSTCSYRTVMLPRKPSTPAKARMPPTVFVHPVNPPMVGVFALGRPAATQPRTRVRMAASRVPRCSITHSGSGCRNADSSRR